MGINEIMDAFTMQVIEDRSKGDKYNPLRPSSAGKCERELGYEFMEYRGLATYQREQNPPDVHRLLNLGSSIEYHANSEMRQAFAKSSKPIKLKYKQQSVTICRLKDGTLIEGSIDLWIETADWRCLADWKSKSDKYSSYYKSSWDEFVEKLVSTGSAHKFGEDAVFIDNLGEFLAKNKDSFFNNNLYQLNLYACTDFARERNLTFCSVLQYNKNDSRIREIRFVPDEAVAKAVHDKIIKVAHTVDTEKSVENLDKQYVLGSQKCGFCSFRSTCWPEDDAMKAYFKELPPKQWPKDMDRLSKDLQAKLVPLFDTYINKCLVAADAEQVELEIAKIMNDAKVYKIKLASGQIYKLKRLKSGGPGGGERLALRRDKL